MTFIEQLHQSIANRLQELRSEISKIEDAYRALNNGAAKPQAKAHSNGNRRPSQPSQPSQPAARKPRPASKVMRAEQLEQLLGESSDGLSTSVIAQRGGAVPAQVLALLRELEQAGRVRRTGERRGTRWHLVTDEDRIAQRAAELAGRSKMPV
jgi:predicted Rossmann fold nucleotide-binding protein DprA/Smf involved in DNA uptake